MSSHHTVQDTNSNTLETSTKKRGRPRKEEPLNPFIDSEHVEILDVSKEDIDLDRELEKIARESEPEMSQETRSILAEGANEGILKKELLGENVFLSEVVLGLSVPQTINQFIDQVHQAKLENVNSIYASEKLVRYYTKNTPFNKVLEKGYFIYDSIKVWLENFNGSTKSTDLKSVEQTIFGGSKIKA